MRGGTGATRASPPPETRAARGICSRRSGSGGPVRIAITPLTVTVPEACRFAKRRRTLGLRDLAQPPGCSCATSHATGRPGVAVMTVRDVGKPLGGTKGHLVGEAEVTVSVGILQAGMAELERHAAMGFAEAWSLSVTMTTSCEHRAGVITAATAAEPALSSRR